MSRLVDPPAWEICDADGDGGLSPEEDAAYDAALEAWYQENEQRPDWFEVKHWYDYQRGEALGRRATAAKAYAWKQRPLSQRIEGRTLSTLSKPTKVAWFGAALVLSFVATMALYIVIFRWFENRGTTDWLYDHEPLQFVLGIPALLAFPFLFFIIFDLLTLGRWDTDNPHIHYPWWR